MNKRILHITGDVRKVRYITNRISILSSVKNVQNKEYFDQWYLDEKGRNNFNAKKIEAGKSYNTYGLSTDIKAIKFTTDGEATISMIEDIEGEPNNNISLEYSYNGADWTTWDMSGLTINADEVLYIRGNNPNGIGFYDYDTGDYSYYTFAMEGDKVYCSGNLKYLLDYENDINEIPNDSFAYLFTNCTNLITAPKITASVLGDYCCDSIYSGCENLEYVPDFNATTVGDGCFSNAFENCSSLIVAPALPAETLSDYCYHNMFHNCSSLIVAPALPAETLSDYCYASMFENCSSLVSVPNILPAPILTSSCYSSMFANCSSLVIAPELPAKTLVNACYIKMFENCSSLNQITALFEKSNTSCTRNWTKNVSTTGTFIMSKEFTGNISFSTAAIPTGWTIVEKQ